MTGKTKRTLVVAVSSITCIALAIGIGMRFGNNSKVPQSEIPDSNESETSSIIMDIDGIDSIHVPETDANKNDNRADPGAGADSTGTEQSIQADPVRPKQPETPKSSAPVQQGQEHTEKNVPESDRNTKEPPKYEQPPQHESPTKPKQNEPAPGSANDSGQVYVPGFGYVEDEGENTVTQANDMYENGNKIGKMG